MKKFALMMVLTAASTVAFAGGCWQNGKYVQCPKTQQPAGQSK